jgi:hypothetical protein
VCAIYHYYVEESPLTIPIGFISSRPNHLKCALALIHQLFTDNNLLYKLDRRASRQPISGEQLFALLDPGLAPDGPTDEEEN